MAQQTVAVIGAGQMGSGIAQVCLQSGYNIVLCDKNAAALQQAAEKLKDHTLKETSIITAQELTATKDANIIIEAVNEDEKLKNIIFQQLSEIISAQQIIASNTSSFAISHLAKDLSYASQFIGIHFMNPAPKMALVEIIPGERTSLPTVEKAQHFVAAINKTGIVIKDSPGFVVNRLLLPMLHEAILILEAGVAQAEDIDQAMTLGASFPMGPLALADYIGLDTVLAIMETLHCDLKNDKYRPCAMLRDYVKAGYLGRKTGRGFYTYQKG